MKKIVNWIIAAIVLIVAGILLLGGAMTMLNWDFSKLSTSKYETNEHLIRDSFQHIHIETLTADIQLLPAQDTNTTVICYEATDNMKHTVTVEEDTLVIAVHDTSKWYRYIGDIFTTPTITLYIPAGTYGDITIKNDTGKTDIPTDFQFENIQIVASTGLVTNHASAASDMRIHTSTGSILVENVTADNLDLSVSTGKITATNITCRGNASIQVSTGKTELTNLSCKNLRSTGATGNISLTRVTASEAFNIERSTGKVTFDRCDAGEISVETDTGDVKGTLLTPKVFFAETDTGTVRVPHSTEGGKCEIITDTGDIIITIE